jgi:hypothetical protein
MGLYVSQEKTYPSIFIAPTMDLTERLEPREKGIVASIGKLSFGNPYRAVILGNNTEQLKTTIPSFGGTQDNEFAYHISDYFAGYKGKMVIGRVLQNNATTKVLQFQRQVKVDVKELTDIEKDIFVVGLNKSINEPYQLKTSWDKETEKLKVSFVKDDGASVLEYEGSIDSADADYIGGKPDAKEAYIAITKSILDCLVRTTILS